MRSKKARFEFVLTEELKQLLKEKAKLKGVTPSEYIRKLIAN